MRTIFILTALGGVFLATILIGYYGLEEVGDAFLSIGIWGFVVITLFRLLPIAICAVAWRSLLPAARPSAGIFIWARWIRDGVGSVLSFLVIGGELAGARVITLYGIRGSMAGASVVVDVTMELLGQFVYTFIGLGLLLLVEPEDAFLGGAVGGLLIAGLVLLGFIFAQNAGLFRFIETLPHKLAASGNWAPFSDSNGLHAGIKAIYRNRRGLVAGFMGHLLAWLVGTGEAWLALNFMGFPLGFWEILILESLVFALRTVAFAVPWSAGVQEGGYIMVGTIFGLAPDVMLALSLLKRAVELLQGVPAVLAWQFFEGGTIWKRKVKSAVEPD